MAATAASAQPAPAGAELPERAKVHWRPRADEAALRRAGRRWTLTTLAHVVPLVATAILLGPIDAVTAVVAVILLAHAWAIPELYANRGAGVLRTGRRGGDAPERRALLLLGDLIDDEARRLHAASGLVLECGQLGVWLLAERGAVLVRPGGRRVHCYCVAAAERDLPSSDRIAHLLLALRCDERGFLTVANLAFAGATWRLGRRLAAPQRIALRAGRRAARAQTRR